MNSVLKLDKISYEVRSKKILSDISFNLMKGEIVSLVGPSGSGKTTILKAIAGLIKPTRGMISSSKKILSSENTLIPTGERKIGLMFQEDVLFPHYTVFKNIEFGLQSENKKIKINIVNKLLKEFKLQHATNLYPDKLSGGEKQRVALARLLTTKPKILLMDEPFSSLDYNLGKEISEFTIKLLKENKISVIFVTHDIKAAFRVSDKLLIVNHGKIIQNDTPQNIYNKPCNQFIAEFVGETNKIKGQVNKEGEILTSFGRFNSQKCKNKLRFCHSKKHLFFIRPEDIKFVKTGVRGRVLEKLFLGDSWEYKVEIKKNLEILKLRTKKGNIKKNELINLKINNKKILVFPD